MHALQQRAPKQMQQTMLHVLRVKHKLQQL
jgi:hypothetical protein